MKTFGKWLLVVVTLGCLTTPVLAANKGYNGQDGQITAFSTTDHARHADTTMPDYPPPDGDDDNPDSTGGDGNDGGPDSTDDGGGCGGSGGGGNDSGPDGTGGTDF